MVYQISNLFKIQSDEGINMYSELKRMGGRSGIKFTFALEAEECHKTTAEIQTGYYPK
jgi:hypothetical protein